MVFDSLKIQSCRLTCSFRNDLNYTDLKDNFLWWNDIFPKSQSIWIFRLFFVFLQTSPRLNPCIIKKKTLWRHCPQKRKRNKKADFDLVFDSWKIQSCRLTCSFLDNLNYADFNFSFSHFPNESINLNFVLVLVILRTLLRLSGRIIELIRCHDTDLKKEKGTKKPIPTWYSIIWKFKVVDSLALFQITKLRWLES